MKKLAAIAVAAVSTLALAGPANAKAPAPGEIVPYAALPISPTKGIFWGQLFSDRSSCVGKRKFGLVVEHPGGKTTVDRGKTSSDGGISGIATDSDLTGATGASFVVAKTSKCAKVTLSLGGGKLAPSKAAGTDVEIVGLGGGPDDGAFGGFVEASKGSCRSNRRIEFLVDGDRIDNGRTTEKGAWSLHITESEFTSGTKFKAVVKKTSKCAGAKGTYHPSMRPSPR